MDDANNIGLDPSVECRDKSSSEDYAFRDLRKRVFMSSWLYNLDQHDMIRILDMVKLDLINDLGE